MSLGIAVSCPEGIVLASESRITLTATTQQPDGQTQPLHVNFDNATKLLSFSDPHGSVGAVTYGAAVIGQRPAHSFVPELEASLPDDRIDVEAFAERMGEFYMDQWNDEVDGPYEGPDMVFVVGGFNEAAAYGEVYEFQIPSNPSPQVRQASGNFGITWGGQRHHVDRLVQGFDKELINIIGAKFDLDQQEMEQLGQELVGLLQMQLPLSAMSLQDCVDLASFFIRTTIDAQQLSVSLRGCGGPIDIATITRRQGLKYIDQKNITAPQQ